MTRQLICLLSTLFLLPMPGLRDLDKDQERDQEQPMVLEVEIHNRVFYVYDNSDVSKLATDHNKTTTIPGKTFAIVVGIGDIVSVNGKPAKGTWVTRLTPVNLTAFPNPGQALADTIRSNKSDSTYEILRPDGTPVGTIMATGLAGGAPPPGSPADIANGNLAITGGTGAFLGARGQVGGKAGGVFGRAASATEDPAFRRVHGGGTQTEVLAIIPDSIQREEDLREYLGRLKGNFN